MWLVQKWGSEHTMAHIVLIKLRGFLHRRMHRDMQKHIRQIYQNNLFALPYGTAERGFGFYLVVRTYKSAGWVLFDQSMTDWRQGTACRRRHVVSTDVQTGWLQWSIADPSFVEVVDSCPLPQKQAVSTRGDSCAPP